ncbi:unnamed protein product, partial [Mesorhabditis spiculigera]
MYLSFGVHVDHDSNARLIVLKGNDEWSSLALVRDAVETIQPALIQHPMLKVVAAPYDALGFTLIAAIGVFRTTLLVYQPETELLTAANEHGGEKCHDGGLAMAQTKTVNGVRVAVAALILVGSGTMDVLELMIKGNVEDPSVPEVLILRRIRTCAPPSSEHIYIPQTSEMADGRFYLYYLEMVHSKVADCLCGCDEHWGYTRAGQWLMELGADLTCINRHEAVVMKEIKPKDSSFQMTVKRSPQTKLVDLEIYYAEQEYDNYLKYAYWNMDKIRFAFTKGVPHCKNFDYDGRTISFLDQENVVNVKVRSTDTARPMPPAFCKGPCYFLHQRGEDYAEGMDAFFTKDSKHPHPQIERLMHYNPRQGSYLFEVRGHVVMGATDAEKKLQLIKHPSTPIEPGLTYSLPTILFFDKKQIAKEALDENPCMLAWGVKDGNFVIKFLDQRGRKLGIKDPDNVDYIVDEAWGRRAKDIKSICLVTEKSQHLIIAWSQGFLHATPCEDRGLIFEDTVQVIGKNEFHRHSKVVDLAYKPMEQVLMLLLGNATLVTYKCLAISIVLYDLVHQRVLFASVKDYQKTFDAVRRFFGLTVGMHEIQCVVLTHFGANDQITATFCEVMHDSPPFQRSMVEHQVRKMVSIHVEKCGLTVIAAIGSQATILVYDPTTETIVNANQHTWAPVYYDVALFPQRVCHQTLLISDNLKNMQICAGPLQPERGALQLFFCEKRLEGVETVFYAGIIAFGVGKNTQQATITGSRKTKSSGNHIASRTQIYFHGGLMRGVGIIQDHRDPANGKLSEKVAYWRLSGDKLPFEFEENGWVDGRYSFGDTQVTVYDEKREFDISKTKHRSDKRPIRLHKKFGVDKVVQLFENNALAYGPDALHVMRLCSCIKSQDKK